MELYHKDIRLPEGFRLPARSVSLQWTKHAERARHDERYGRIRYFSDIDLATADTIEVGVENGRVVKLVLRKYYSDTMDIIFVLIPHQPTPNRWTVKTVWLNEANDSHKTLDRSRYVV